MVIDKLFEKIRREEVAIFVGSGLSIYAGYKGANDLKKAILLLCQSYCLDEVEKQNLSTKNLEEITDYLVSYSNGQRTELNKLILDEYSKKPTATYVHDILSRIPHFEHIFTSNYDTLIEDAMQNRCSIIRREVDFSLQNKNQPKVYKIHGDVHSLENIILTKKDYSHNLKNSSNNLIWNRLQDIAASKDFLFIGYSYEDSNVWEIFEKLKAIQGNSKRQKFIISPGLNQNQVNRLTQEGFHYFDFTGELFLNKTIDVLKDNAVKDLEDNLLTVDTFKKFLSFHDKKVIIKTDRQKVVVENILDANGLQETEVKLTLPIDMHKAFVEFNKGLSQERSFKLTQKDFLSLNIKMGGFTIAQDENTIASFEILKLPTNRNLAIESDDQVVNLQRIDCQHYRFNKGSEFEFLIVESKFVFQMNFTKKMVKVTANFDLQTKYKNVTDVLTVLQFLFYIDKGYALNFYFEGLKKPFELTGQRLKNIKGNWNIEGLRNYFINIRTIEKYFKVRFEHIDFEKIVDNDLANAKYLAKIIDSGYVLQSLDGDIRLPTIVKRYSDKVFNELELPNTSFNIIMDGEVIYEFFGSKIDPIYILAEVEAYQIKHTDDGTLLTSKTGRWKHRFLSAEKYKEYKSIEVEVSSSSLKD